MYRNKSKRLLAVFLIANFIFCNTPTSVLHALFASHRDAQVTCNVDASVVHFDVAGIDCHCNSNVVNIPYIQATVPDVFNPVFKYFQYHDAPVNGPGSIDIYSLPLRGPPVVS